MNVLIEVLQTKTERELISMYAGFKRKGNYTSAARLRTAFLQYFLFVENKGLTEGIQYFAHEEINIMNVLIEKWTKEEKDSFKRREFSDLMEYSRIAPFIMDKVHKAGMLSNRVHWDFGDALVKQGTFLTYSQFEKAFNEFVFFIYAYGTYINRKKAFDNFMKSIPTANEIAFELSKSILRGNSIYKWEKIIWDKYEAEKKSSEVVDESLIECMLLLFAYYYNKDFNAQQLTYLRLMKSMNEKHPLYWTIRFLGKELKLTEVE